jgi:hypothetical protein
MSICHKSLLLLALLLLAGTAAAATPAGRVELEIVGEAQMGAAMAFQEWSQALSRAGIQNFRLRSAQENDKPSIDVRGTEQSPTYVVTAIITARDEIVVPGVRFRRSELRRLAEWIDDLAKRGPPDKREPTAAFGLTLKQFEKVHDDLAKPVGFSTKGMSRADAVAKIGGQLGFPLRVEGKIPGDDKIEEELSELSCGTALACIVRPAGFAMTPHEAGESLAYTVAKAKLDQEVWPIGWPPKSPQQTLPALYEFHNVNVQGVTATKVLEVIGKQLKAPVLMDHNALARHGIEPDKAAVSHPQMRTNYSMALRKMLFKAGLKFEVRVDEADKPFLWISSVKPV